MVGWVEQAPKSLDITMPNHARVYDFFLGGKDNFAADRIAAEKIAKVAPDTGLLARANRGFLIRAVRLMAESGISQFIDLGTGIPTSPSVHEVARVIDPSARVVYVDNDPMVAAHNSALLASDEGLISVLGDLTRPDEVLTDPRLRAVIDFAKPVGLLCVAVLHLVTDAQNPTGIVADFAARLAPDSYIAICQFSAEGGSEAISRFKEIYANGPVRITFRPRSQILTFFDCLELLPPGLTEVENWRPEMQPLATRLKIVGGVGRKN